MNEEAPYEEILNAAKKVHPRFAKILYEKYDADRTAFIKAVEEATEGKTPRDWAKRNCKKCYGTAIIGTRNGVELPCRCIEKNYYKFLQEFRIDFNKQRDDK